MKERIRELALDAGLINYVDHETPRTYFINGHADIEEVQEFAEFIIRECALICESRPGPGDDVRSRQHCSLQILEHFGVEETP